MEKKEFIKELVREINEEIREADDVTYINEYDNFVDNGVDSINFIKIIIFIETKYSIEVEDEFLTLEKLSNIVDIADYLWDKINE